MRWSAGLVVFAFAGGAVSPQRPDLVIGDFEQPGYAGWTVAGKAFGIFDRLTTRQGGQGAYFRDPFPGNRIPAQRFDPVARNAVAFYPEPNTAPVNPFTQVNNYFKSGKTRSDDDDLILRADHNFTASWRTYARIGLSKSNFEPVDFFGNLATPGRFNRSNDSRPSISFDNTITLNPNTIAPLRYGLARVFTFRELVSNGFDVTSLGFSAYMREQAGRSWLQFPTFNLTGLSALGPSGDSNRAGRTSHNATGSLTKVSGRHTWKTGAEFRKWFHNNFASGGTNGSFSFTPAWTQRDPARTSALEGYSLASFLLGVGGGSQTDRWAEALSSSYFGMYVQDDFGLTRNLTLNLGLRYEFDTPRTERYNRLSYFDLTAPSPLQGQVAGFPGLMGAMRFVDGGNRRQTPTDRNNLSPRFGFAYKLGEASAVRGGYALMYAPSLMQAASQQAGFQGLQASTSMVVSLDGRTPITFLRDPFPNGFNRPLGSAPGPLSGPATDLGLNIGDSWFIDCVNPVIQQWNLTVQRALGSGLVVEAGYLASKGNHIMDGEANQYNQLPAEFLALGDRLNDLVPNPFFGHIANPNSALSQPAVRRAQLLHPYPQYTTLTASRRPMGNSVYHAFTMRVERRFSRGFGWLLSYTGGKLIDDSSWGNTLAASGGTKKQDVYNRAAERALSAEDISRRLVFSGVAELPFGRGRRRLGDVHPVADSILGGWQVNAILTLQSGLPVELGQVQNNTGLGSSGQRPNNNGNSAKLEGGMTDERLRRWFNPSVFSVAPAFTFGNGPRVLPDVRHPGIRNIDLSVFKVFRFKENVNLQFRAEAFNAFNTPQFGAAASVVGNPNIGVISDTRGDPRQLQLALKLLF